MNEETKTITGIFSHCFFESSEKIVFVMSADCTEYNVIFRHDGDKDKIKRVRSIPKNALLRVTGLHIVECGPRYDGTTYVQHIIKTSEEPTVL